MSDLSIYSYNENNPTPIIIKYKSRNTDTSLTLIGNDSYNYGQDLLTNLLQLTENFCSPNAPSKPIQGQVYYNSETKKLNVFDTDWSQITNIPNTELIDFAYIDSTVPTSNSHLILDDMLKTYIKYSGSDVLCSIHNPFHITLNNEAVTKEYVDSIFNKSVDNLVPIMGQCSMTGPLLLGNLDASSPKNALVNIRYIQSIGSINPEIDKSDNTKTITKYNITNLISATTAPGIFTTVWFNTTIPDAASSVTISLPFQYKPSLKIKPVYNMVVNCNSIGNYTKLHITIIDGQSFTISRTGTTGELHISGSVMGLQSTSNNSVA